MVDDRLGSACNTGARLRELGYALANAAKVIVRCSGKIASLAGAAPDTPHPGIGASNKGTFAPATEEGSTEGALSLR